MLALQTLQSPTAPTMHHCILLIATSSRSHLPTNIDLRTATVFVSSSFCLAAAVQLCLDGVDQIAIIYSPGTMYLASAIAVAICRHISEPKLCAISSCIISGGAIASGSYLDFTYIASHPELPTLIIVALALKCLALFACASILVRAASHSCSNAALHLPLYSSQTNLSNPLFEEAEESNFTGASYDESDSDSSDGEAFALLEKSFAERERHYRHHDHTLFLGKQNGGELDASEGNVLYVDVDDDVARAIMRSGARLQGRLETAIIPKVEVQVTIEVTRSYA